MPVHLMLCMHAPSYSQVVVHMYSALVSFSFSDREKLIQDKSCRLILLGCTESTKCLSQDVSVYFSINNVNHKTFYFVEQEKEVQNHQMEIESPMTDHQIMDGERQTVTSFTVNGYHSDNPDNDGLEQVDLDQDNTWVVPIDQSITAQEVQDIAGKTEDTHF